MVQRFETDGGDRCVGRSVERDRVHVVGRRAEIDEQPGIFDLRQRCAFVGLPDRRVEDCPASFGLRGDRFLPIGQTLEQFRIEFLERLLGRVDLGIEPLLFSELIGGWDRQARFVALIEDGEDFVEVSLRDWVVLVRVTLSTADRQAEPRGSGRVDAIDDRFDAKLFLIGSSFLVDQRVAVKAGGDELLGRCVRQQVAGKLFQRELVERHVGVDRVDDPLAVLPNLASRIDREAIRVGVACDVEPMPSMPLAIGRRREQSIHESLVGIRFRVIHEVMYLVR